MTKIFFDTEFTGLRQNTTLISIGLIAETGESFYAELTDYDYKQCDKWIKENVLSKLILEDLIKNRLSVLQSSTGPYTSVRGTKEVVSAFLAQWLEQFEEVQMWSDCLAYDWVLFNDLAADFTSGYPVLPKGVSYIPMDICTLFQLKGIDPDTNRESYAYEDKYFTDYGQNPHNAMWDAQVIKSCYEKLIAI